MRYSASSNHEIIHSAEDSEPWITHTLRQLVSPKSTLYNWYAHYLCAGLDALEDKNLRPTCVLSKVEKDTRQQLCAKLH